MKGELTIKFWVAGTPASASVEKRLDIAGWDRELRNEARYLMETERVMAQEIGFIIARGITRDNKTFVTDLRRLLCAQLLIEEVGDARTAITSCVYEQDAENIAKPLLLDSYVFRNDDKYPERLNVPALAEKRIGEIFTSSEVAATRLGEPGTYPSPSLLNEYLLKSKRERFTLALTGRNPCHRPASLAALREAFLAVGREDVEIVEETGCIYLLSKYPENDEAYFRDALREFLPAYVVAQFMTVEEKNVLDLKRSPPERAPLRIMKGPVGASTSVGSATALQKVFGLAHDNIKKLT